MSVFVLKDLCKLMSELQHASAKEENRDMAKQLMKGLHQLHIDQCSSVEKKSKPDAAFVLFFT